MRTRIIIGLCVAISLLGFPQRAATEDLPKPPPTLEQYVQDIFGVKAKVALAVFKHESHLNLQEKNYNCFYHRKDGTRYSTTCKTKDIPHAWSVDCGIAQINTKGTVCPPELLNLKGNMLAVAKIYHDQGLKAWVSYTSGAYKAFL